MSDSITDRIADIVTDHHWYCTAGEPWPWQKGALLVCSAAGCDGTYGNLFEFDAHVAEVIVEQLGLIQQWAAAVDDPGAPVPYTHSGDQRSDAEEDATNLDGGYVVTRYVTKWEAD
jgi:hypothetical protein